MRSLKIKMEMMLAKRFIASLFVFCLLCGGAEAKTFKIQTGGKSVSKVAICKGLGTGVVVDERAGNVWLCQKEEGVLLANFKNEFYERSVVKVLGAELVKTGNLGESSLFQKAVGDCPPHTRVEVYTSPVDQNWQEPKTNAPLHGNIPATVVVLQACVPNR